MKKFYIQFKKEELDKALHCVEVIKNRNYSTYNNLINEIHFDNDRYKEPIAIWVSNDNSVYVNVVNGSNRSYWKENDIKELTYEEFLDL